jgi:hypothetical protein
MEDVYADYISDLDIHTLELLAGTPGITLVIHHLHRSSFKYLPIEYVPFGRMSRKTPSSGPGYNTFPRNDYARAGLLTDDAHPSRTLRHSFSQHASRLLQGHPDPAAGPTYEPCAPF